MEAHYRTLGLSPGASETEIKKAYRKLAIQYHPDKNPEPGAAEIFKKISEAYQILTNPPEPSPRPSNPFARRGPPPFAQSVFIHPDDLFRHFFSQHGFPQAPRGPPQNGPPGPAQGFTRGPQQGQQHRVFIRMPHQSGYMSHTSVSIRNGKKVETKTETYNGKTTQTTRIYDVSTNQLLEENSGVVMDTTKMG
jgi:DnaJ-class molecular chaperone